MFEPPPPPPPVGDGKSGVPVGRGLSCSHQPNLQVSVHFKMSRCKRVWEMALGLVDTAKVFLASNILVELSRESFVPEKQMCAY